jgi:CBS domain containing-hemolysin-like protein
MNNMQFINTVRMTMSQRPAASRLTTRIGLLLASLTALLAAVPAHASFMQGETLAKAANVLAIVVLVLVPVIGITVFWLVHILPEKIAHKRHHPQTEAIQVLCLLSLVFGGMLWPIAWLWAYSKPVLYKMAYGTDKLEQHDAEATAAAAAGATSLSDDVAQLRADIDRLVSQGGATGELASIRDRLAALEPRLAARTEGTR